MIGMKINENSMNAFESMNFNNILFGHTRKKRNRYNDLRNNLNHFPNTIKRMS